MKLFDRWRGAQNETIENDSLGHVEVEKLPLTPEEEQLLAPVQAVKRRNGRQELLTLENGSLGLFKAGREKQQPTDRGSLAQRERAAYLVDKVLGFGVVPPTVLREVDGRDGAAQQFIPNEVDRIDLDYKEMMEKPEFIKLSVFDYIIAITDRDYRTHRNFLMTKIGEVYAVDNELTFKGYGHADNFLEKPLTPEVVECLKQFSQGDKSQLLKTELADLLDGYSIERCIHRINKLSSLVEQYGNQIPKTETDSLNRI